jgi:hypothetical protein
MASKLAKMYSQNPNDKAFDGIQHSFAKEFMQQRQ